MNRCKATGKVQFRTADDAYGYARAMNSYNMRAYVCDHCNKYHFTRNALERYVPKDEIIHNQYLTYTV